MTVRSLFVGAFVVTSMLTFTGCQTAPKPEAKRDAAADTAAITALNNQSAAAFNANDAAAVAATFTDDAIMMPENQAAVEGRAAIQAWYAAMFKYDVKSADTPLEIQVAGDWAYERGNGTVTATPKSGKPITISLKYLRVIKRQADGSWKGYRLIVNSNNPPPAATAKKK
jgi:uncharacterized protein (TIGR02246 family)